MSGRIIIPAGSPSRRGFLSKLVALPLVGGGLRLIGAPSAAAVPISPAMLRRYLDFLSRELFAAQVELRLIESPEYFHDMGLSLTDSRTWRALPLWWELPDDPHADAVVTASPSSGRAAVVMASVGLGL